MIQIDCVVEGAVDEAISRKLLLTCKLTPGRYFGGKGKGHILKQIENWNRAARHSPWFILLDLDHDAGCAPKALQKWLPRPHPNLHLRIAVREIESWLLADRSGFSHYFRVAADKVTAVPDALDNPKQEIINLCRKSSDPGIRKDMVPKIESHTHLEGPAYSSRLIEFIQNKWNPHQARQNSSSLKKCLNSLALWNRAL